MLALGLSSGSASAYPCKPPDPAPAAFGVRILAGHVVVQQKDCEPEPSRPARRGNADPMSFVFFIGILVAVVLVPVTIGRREKFPAE